MRGLQELCTHTTYALESSHFVLSLEDQTPSPLPHKIPPLIITSSLKKFQRLKRTTYKGSRIWWNTQLIKLNPARSSHQILAITPRSNLQSHLRHRGKVKVFYLIIEVNNRWPRARSAFDVSSSLRHRAAWSLSKWNGTWNHRTIKVQSYLKETT